MFKVIKDSIFFLGLFGGGASCLATDYDWRPGSEISTSSNSRSSEEDEVITERANFAVWLQGRVLGTPHLTIRINGLHNGGISIQNFAALLENPAQVIAASFGGPGWTFNNNAPIPIGQSTVTIGNIVYTIVRALSGPEKRKRGFAPEKDKGNKDNSPKNSQGLVQ
ncbi:MAG: hypothetical protein BGO07_01800 [Alphaproteobacteria bacterium 40-19]|nr:MAG: hypothetical protein BGO07_01800 [Alphaproteobacteria bacterium 40-19]